MRKILQFLPANRVAAIAGVLVAIATILTTFVTDANLTGTKAGDAAIGAAAILGSLATVLGIVWKFLEGAQNYDSLLLAGVPKVSSPPVVAPGKDLTDAPLGATDGDADAEVNVGAVVNITEPPPEV